MDFELGKLYRNTKFDLPIYGHKGIPSPTIGSPPLVGFIFVMEIFMPIGITIGECGRVFLKIVFKDKYGWLVFHPRMIFEKYRGL